MMKIKNRIEKSKSPKHKKNITIILVLFYALNIFYATAGECQETIDGSASWTEIIASWINKNATDDSQFEFKLGINGWYPDEDGPDPENSTDNYYISYSGNAVINFGVTDQIRFPGTHSVKFHTDANIDVPDAPYNSVIRTELHLDDVWRLPGRAREGNTVWMGWSEKWTDIDESHTTVTLQFRSNCIDPVLGSPAVELKILPTRMMQVRARYERTDLITVEENVWYDIIVEMKYSKADDGYVKVWIYKAGNNPNYHYSDPPTGELLNMPTMWDDDNRPHFRWGIYRWESCNKLPEEIPVEDRLMTKYIGPARWKFGNDLFEEGFEAVKPRPIQTNDVNENEILYSEWLPNEFALMQNYPNPFNPSTTISFHVAKVCDVNLQVFNMQGQLVQTLHTGNLSIGTHHVTWDGTDATGNRVASGVYFYKMTTKNFIATRKLLFMN